MDWVLWLTGLGFVAVVVLIGFWFFHEIRTAKKREEVKRLEFLKQAGAWKKVLEDFQRIFGIPFVQDSAALPEWYRMAFVVYARLNELSKEVNSARKEVKVMVGQEGFVQVSEGEWRPVFDNFVRASKAYVNAVSLAELLEIVEKQ